MHQAPHPSRCALRGAALGALAIAGLALSGCAGVVGPASKNADRLANLWWTSFGISVVLFVMIMALLLYALFRRRGGTPTVFEHTPRAATLFIIGAGAVIPVVILTGIFAYSVQISAANTETKPDALRIDVVSHDWYWEFRYPDQGITTINTMHIPVGRPIDLTVTATDVIHSFWVPELDGKVDALPGLTTRMTFTAKEVAEYRGRCAEFCGKGHACMDFATVAEETPQFDDWVATVKQLPFRLPTLDDVNYMLDQCINHQNTPVCMPTGCPPNAAPSRSVSRGAGGGSTPDAG